MTLRDLVQKAGQRAGVPFVDGLALVRRTAPGGFEAVIYEPVVCLILQGQKATTVGDRTVVVSAGHSLIVSHDLPVVAQVIEATVSRPYLSLVAPIDLSELHSLREEMGEGVGELDHGGMEPASAFEVSAVDDPMLAVFERYLALADDPTEARVLAPLLRRELHFRLLRAHHGGMLRNLLRRNAHASNIARAIKMLRADFRRRFEMGELAQVVGMSASSFYKHFKAVTSTSPLQYQKDLRLTEARRLLLGGRHTVSTAAFEVGYESPSQFSREYSRKFGTPPRADLPRAS